MERGGGEDLGLDKLGRSFYQHARKIRRGALGKRAYRLGGRTLAALALAFAALVAIPPFTWPVGGRVSSAFFFRHKPDSARILDLEFHRGLDIAAAEGSLVRATAPGIVIETGRSAELGNYVKMRHPLGIISLYGHLSRIDVAKGRLILFRSLSGLGAVGSTGRSTGPHLHFALEAGGLYLPPRGFLFFHSLRKAALGF